MPRVERGGQESAESTMDDHIFFGLYWLTVSWMASHQKVQHRHLETIRGGEESEAERLKKPQTTKGSSAGVRLIQTPERKAVSSRL